MGDVQIIQQGTGKTLWLRDVLFVPTFKKKLISMTSLTKNGNSINVDNTFMTMTNGVGSMTFCRESDGMFYLHGSRVASPNENHTSFSGVTAISTTTIASNNQPTESASTLSPKMLSMTKNEAHRVFGHVGVQVLDNTAKHIGIKLTGELSTCGACALAKAKQRPVSKATNSGASRPAERIFVDTSGPYP
jgi:hypothetical protein